MWRVSVIAALVATLAVSPFLYWPLRPRPEPGPDCLAPGESLFTAASLWEHRESPSILLAFLGVVYNVSSASFYQPGGSYSVFAGRDATRAFLTGHFQEDGLADDVSDLAESELAGLDTWADLYEHKYPRVGVVVGVYYDERGCPTPRHAHVQSAVSRAKRAEREEEADLVRFPPCNSEWHSQSNRGRVWCSPLSGGVSRHWAGKPRLFLDSSASWRCACVQSDQEEHFCDHAHSHAHCRLRHYPECDQDASECATGPE